jgi:hypothetical protein
MREFADILSITCILKDEIRSRFRIAHAEQKSRLEHTKESPHPEELNSLKRGFKYVAKTPARPEYRFVKCLRPNPDLVDGERFITHLTPFVNAGADIMCLHCGREFDHRPVHAVESLSERKRMFRIFGYFCCWNCAKAHIMESSTNFGPRCANLFSLYRAMGGRNRNVSASGGRSTIREFGGTIPRSDFTLAYCKDILPADAQLDAKYIVRFV